MQTMQEHFSVNNMEVVQADKAGETFWVVQYYVNFGLMEYNTRIMETNSR